MFQPTSMDEDSMPKDRMALLADPAVPSLIYVAGNAGALAWRVDVSKGADAKWTKLWDDDVIDGSLPHGDCRNYAWDPQSSRLILVSDGGAFAREQPRQSGGRWVSLNGDIAQMEYLSAHYNPRQDSFVAGAQDNAAQVFARNQRATGFVEGDGTVTMIDNVHNPSRMYGTTQFLGVGTIDIDPENSLGQEDDDDDCGGLCFNQGDDFIGVPLKSTFPPRHRSRFCPPIYAQYATSIPAPLLGERLKKCSFWIQHLC